MSSKNISLRDEAYRRLEALKREGESFSDVVLRLTEEDKWSGFGALAGSNVRDGMGRAHRNLTEAFERDIAEPYSAVEGEDEAENDDEDEDEDARAR
jgi:predicted CopG family antitoxin